MARIEDLKDHVEGKLLGILEESKIANTSENRKSIADEIARHLNYKIPLSDSSMYIVKCTSDPKHKGLNLEVRVETK